MDEIAADQLNRLRQVVLRSPGEGGVGCVLVTSAVDGEGKTTVALGLARAIARSLDHQALLVEADLRRPRIDRSLGLEPGPGVVSYVLGGISLDGVARPTAEPKLFAVPAGEARSDAAEVVASGRMLELAREAREHDGGSVVVLDAPPVLATAEAPSLAQAANAIVLVVRAGSTPRSAVREALSSLPPGKVAGIVLNDARLPRHEWQRYRATASAAARASGPALGEARPVEAGWSLSDASAVS